MSIFQLFLSDCITLYVKSIDSILKHEKTSCSLIIASEKTQQKVKQRQEPKGNVHFQGQKKCHAWSTNDLLNGLYEVYLFRIRNIF